MFKYLKWQERQILDGEKDKSNQGKTKKSKGQFSQNTCTWQFQSLSQSEHTEHNVCYSFINKLEHYIHSLFLEQQVKTITNFLTPWTVDVIYFTLDSSQIVNATYFYETSTYYVSLKNNLLL